MDRDVALVTTMGKHLETGNPDAALELVGQDGTWRKLGTQGHWVHRVRDGAVVSCIGVASACGADAVVAA